MASDRETRFGLLLRQTRLSAGLTQEQLAERAGLSTRGVSDLERGVNHVPRHETVAHLAEALALAGPERAAFIAAGRAPDDSLAASSEARRPALPRPLTSLVGREHDEAAVSHLLDQGVRLLTLSGPGGVGKTRLALQVAHTLAATFADGVAFVALAALRDPALVPATVAQALGLVEMAGRPWPELLARHLRERHLLLLLDNMEQIVAAAPLLPELLGACPRLTIVVTSRVALHVGGEHTYAVPPLTVPAGTPAPDLAGADQAAAVQLFVQRAQTARPGFALTTTNASTLGEICRRLDGLPLAIELAAARVTLLPLPALLRHLDHGLALLTNGARDQPARQQTMRAAIVWSYDLLDADEQALFRRLAVFMGGSTIEAATAVCGADGAAPPAVLAGLGALVDHSLIQVTGTEQEPRFVMLELIREFAWEALAASGEAPALCRAHAQHFLTLAEEAAPQLVRLEQGAWGDRLEREHDNLRAALRWCAQPDGDVALGLRLAAALGRFWRLRGHLAEGRGWLDRLLALDDNNGAPNAAIRVKALLAAGTLATWAGEHEPAAALYEESLTLARGLGDKRSIANALINLGVEARDRLRYDRAATLFEESVAHFRDLGEPEEAGWVFLNYAFVMREQGRYTRAVDLLTEGLARFRALEHKDGIGWTLLYLGEVARDQQDGARATALYEESLTYFRDAGDSTGVAFAHTTLGLAARDRGDYGRAAELIEESVAGFREIGESRLLLEALASLGRLRYETGDCESAAALFAEAFRLSRTRRLPLYFVFTALEGTAGLARARGGAERAARLLGAAEALRAAQGIPPRPAYRARHDREVSAVRAALEPALFQSAWAAGGTLSLDEAIDEALETL